MRRVKKLWERVCGQIAEKQQQNEADLLTEPQKYNETDMSIELQRLHVKEEN